MAPKHFAPVWQHYERHEPTGRSKHHRAICKFCKYELSGQPERMKTHLQRCSSCPDEIKEEFSGEDCAHPLSGAHAGGSNGSFAAGGRGDMDGLDDDSPEPTTKRMRSMDAADAPAWGPPPSAGGSSLAPTLGPVAAASFASVYESVRGYYSRVTPMSRVQMSIGATVAPHPVVREAIGMVPKAVRKRFYGCGVPLPAGIEGLRVLDLGCGAGRDCYVAARLVGPGGEVIGIDMTDEQLRVAREWVPEYARTLGYQPHLRFVKGYIEFLGQLPGLYAGSIDLCISNNAVNLSPNKELVLRSVFDVLKEGGEFQFSDIYTDRRLPSHVRSHPALMGESVGGALYTEDFRRLCARVGFVDVRMASPPAVVRIDAPELRDLVGATRFHSITYRLFKFARAAAQLETTREDYGHVAVYRGTIDGQRARTRFDTQWAFEASRPVLVDGNTAAMLGESWLRRHFDVRGDRTQHLGAFAAAPADALYEPWETDHDDADRTHPSRRGVVPLPTPYFISGLRRAASPSAPASLSASHMSSPAPELPLPPPEPPAPPLLAHRSSLRDHGATFPRLSSFSISQSNVRADAGERRHPPGLPLLDSYAMGAAPRFVVPVGRVSAPFKPPGPALSPVAAQPAMPGSVSSPAMSRSSPMPRSVLPAMQQGSVSSPASAAVRSPMSAALMSISPRHLSPPSVAAAAPMT
ncbi:hypothetical protein GGI04_004525 [Coemansia thaxteri]|nr:hypothetical protein GGI04_004525 [Coemansia thaxteri]